METITFFDLCWNDQVQGRVVFKLFKDIPRSRLFYIMCSGRRGISYKDCDSLEVHNYGTAQALISGGVCTAAAVDTFEDLIHDDSGLETHFSTPGLLTVSTDEDSKHRMNFYVNIRSQKSPYMKNVIGEVISGLDILRAAARYEPNSENRSVSINDCGIIIHF